MIFVFHVVQDQTGKQKFVTATDSLMTGIEVFNRNNFRDFDYTTINILDDKGIVITGIAYLPVGNLSYDKIMKEIGEIKNDH